jgi:hypothetical protein
VPNQAISSGTYNFPDNNALSATNVINDSVSVTFVAGNGIQLHPGFHAIAGLAATTLHVGGNSDIRCVRFAFERKSPQWAVHLDGLQPFRLQQPVRRVYSLQPKFGT